MPEYRQHAAYKLLIGDDGSVIGPRGEPLKPRLTNAGYLRVVVYPGGKFKAVLVHRLVAEMFLEKTNEFVNHKDGDKKNNSAANLEWCSRSENALHAVALGLIDHKARGRAMKASGATRGTNNGRAKLTDDDVRSIRSQPAGRYGEKPWTKYWISNVMYRLIRIGKNWSHVS